MTFTNSSELNNKAIIPTLYIIATPIGNIKDITYRAVETLQSLSYIACEDTRVSAKLLQHYNVKAKTFSYHEHNKDFASDKIIEKLKSGYSIGLISDAGMPLISDPGYVLVKKCLENDIKVTCLPGASSSITALAISGMPSDSFYFNGFLPSKKSSRVKNLKTLKAIKSTLIIFESAKRLVDTLIDIKEVIGDVEVSVTRELTKKFEEVKKNNVSNLICFYEDNGAPKGEIVLIVKNDIKEEMSPEEVDSLILKYLKDYKVKDVSKKLAEEYGLNKNEIYKRALEIK
ncbi:MAG: 16S rRNA (cytidine(1402)-2'-O)-methyltransferase [Alphaproteobacteria bacterium]|nr:16S rRNA (cytidine(1402)-2'-O)-methyltransferase [Alphaproteobacteria bacterium]